MKYVKEGSVFAQETSYFCRSAYIENTPEIPWSQYRNVFNGKCIKPLAVAGLTKKQHYFKNNGPILIK
jgi:hypothetical protein